MDEWTIVGCRTLRARAVAHGNMQYQYTYLDPYSRATVADPYAVPFMAQPGQGTMSSGTGYSAS